MTMRKLEIANAEVVQLAVQEEIGRSEEARYDHRLHGILLLCRGLSCREVAELFGCGARTVHYWVRRFEHSGFAGLREGERPGRPPRLDESVRQQLGRDLRRCPRELGYAQTLWDGKLLAFHLKQAYGIPIGVRQCQRLFHQLGFRRRKPRPVIAQADPQAQAGFKKNCAG
jgi:transposase